MQLRRYSVFDYRVNNSVVMARPALLRKYIRVSTLIRQDLQEKRKQRPYDVLLRIALDIYLRTSDVRLSNNVQNIKAMIIKHTNQLIMMSRFADVGSSF